MNNSKFIDNLKNYSKNDPKFQILHLNINSILNNLNDVDSILNLRQFDIVFLCETKLDDSFPNSFYKNDHYFIIRLDRSRHGGGLIVFIKNSLVVTKSVLLEKLELIYFQIRINGQKINFVYSYKAPNLKEQLFIDHLEEFLHSLSLNEPLFIIGDLNMDYNLTTNSNIRKFIDNNELINFVTKPTRISTKYYKKPNVTRRTSIMIDLILHNGDLVEETEVIDCPFSDHHFVVAKLAVKKPSNVLKTIDCRNLSAVNMFRINSMIDEIDFKQLRNLNDIDSKWMFLKNEITNILDKVAPLRKITLKNSNQFPWYDEELLKLKHLKDASYKRHNRTCPSEDKDLFEYYNKLFKSYNEERMIEYFKDKTVNDFKNSKKFWEYYSSKINIKSDKSSSNPISHVKYNGTSTENKNELCNLFNKFFTSISSSSECSFDEAPLFVDDQLDMNLTNDPCFKFSLTTANEVEELLSTLPSTGAPVTNVEDFNILNNELSKYNLECYQHRLIKRIARFIYKVCNNKNGPMELKASLVKNKDIKTVTYKLRNNCMFYMP
ncbi:RNA-directed DNA polymerase from mobile element jockey-like [Brachionus plicatilis]|uniref:RNA-directed DNA polymerase from mobile element jockey-like n=1 Tax=Brachionus plicatilis TaxID=10195 RepID=A0A3M7PUW5_BRAPC|nr:RNA-directed DNA polymerase from mobile element jockey-like [Brachionus plicatilis]